MPGEPSFRPTGVSACQSLHNIHYARYGPVDPSSSQSTRIPVRIPTPRVGLSGTPRVRSLTAWRIAPEGMSLGLPGFSVPALGKTRRTHARRTKRDGCVMTRAGDRPASGSGITVVSPRDPRGPPQRVRWRVAVERAIGPPRVSPQPGQPGSIRVDPDPAPMKASCGLHFAAVARMAGFHSCGNENQWSRRAIASTPTVGAARVLESTDPFGARRTDRPHHPHESG